MSADNRSVSTDALATLGTIIDASQKRDAIHLAVIPAVAGMDLSVGDDVGIVDGVATTRAPVKLGIVDPFLKEAVRKDQRFWLVIYPRVITSLRHVWTHPQIEDEASMPLKRGPMTEKERSEEWIRGWAANIPLSYETIMAGAHDYVADKKRGGYGDYLCFGGLLEGEFVPDEFWPHYEIVTGVSVEENHRGSFFTCSC